jgi:hypothetical protein
MSTSKTYFGIFALFTAFLAVALISANIGVAYLDITPSLFSQLNRMTALGYCAMTPLTLLLAVMGIIRKAESPALSMIAIVLVAIPFSILFIRMLSSISISQ